MTLNHPPRERVSAIRDFPPFCGRNSLHLIKEDSLKALASSKRESLGQEKSGLGHKLSEETVRLGAKQLGEDVRDGNGLQRKLKGIVSRKVGDNVQAESEEKATKEMRKQAKVGRSYDIKAEREDTREKSIRPSCKSYMCRPEHKSQTVIKRGNRDVGSLQGKAGLELAVDRVIEQGLTTTPYRPWRQRKGAFRSDPTSGTSRSKVKKHVFTGQDKSDKSIYISRTKMGEAENLQLKSTRDKSLPTGKAAFKGIGPPVVWDDEDSFEGNEEHEDFHVDPGSHDFDASLPPFGPSSSRGKVDDHDANVTRNKVKETLLLFRVVCRNLEKTKLKEGGNTHFRVDFEAARVLRDDRKYVNRDKKIFGSVPGVEVGDMFQYRMELAVIGLHRLPESGIDYIHEGGKSLATSIVVSGGYDDDLGRSDALVYVGQGGNLTCRNKRPEDQVLKRGNLALMNSIDAKNHVRVIRKTKVTDYLHGRYTYDGLYCVSQYWCELGPHKKLVYKFWLDRIPGQPKLVLNQV